MTKEVILSITGLQFDSIDPESREPVEIITVGEYYKRNDKHYVIFQEVLEGFEGSTKNTLKISDNGVDIIKKGVTNVHMVFEKDKKNITCYNTPYGNLMIGILANDVRVEEQDEDINVQVAYNLDINYEHLAECKIAIQIKSKTAKSFSLEAPM
ncbi:DUF1934 domain-containing protein [Konateibacter massiliensis]|uniref:DUF1934 domain-containing protein n=1 Tax=Konateibacter massiliensis TaxID=2002841 RepID=UPI000C1574B6|nr:DUF1934 domain-containing protein [Konateibacter massiliensis]